MGGGGVNPNIRHFELTYYNVSLPFCSDYKTIAQYLAHNDRSLYIRACYPVMKYTIRQRYDKLYRVLSEQYKHTLREHYKQEQNAILKAFLANSFQSFDYPQGYFQDITYFKDIDSIIRQEFTLKDSLQGHNAEWEQKILATPKSVFLHIRLGDYISHETQGTFFRLGKTYYQTAINIMKEKLGTPHIFIFSNDIEWCANNLVNMLDFNGCNVEFVKGNDEGNAAYEMQLMRSCKHAIIANSTFSWWAAYLMENPDKFVIIPHQFFNISNTVLQMSKLSQKGFVEVDGVWGTHRVIE